MSELVVRSTHEAFRQYLAPLQRAVAAFAADVFLLRTGADPRVHAARLRFAGQGVAVLRDGAGEPQLVLVADLFYRVVERPELRRRWTTQTVAYFYRLDRPSHPHRSMVAYHWHPQVVGLEFPHVHFLAAERPELRRLHIATPHCTLRHVLSFAMRDFSVRPLRDDWSQALDKADGALQASMAWAARAPFSSPQP